MQPPLRWLAVLGVFTGSLMVLSWNAGGPGIATAYVDPVAKIQAQDEAFYGSVSLGMADHGSAGYWLTPRFLGRYAITKPPVLNWLQAGALRIVRSHKLAFRLPSLLAGSATAAIVFCWLLYENAPAAAALAGAFLLLSSHLFFVLSRVGLTDALLTFETTLAMFALARDPRLSSRAGLWTFGSASGAALMTKGIAGLFPILALAVLCIVSRERPSWSRLAQAVAIIAAIAAPWHLYELARHTRWFWAEYVMTESVTHGIGSPPQSTQESQPGYYLKRLIALDPLLLAFALASLAWKRPRVPLAWILVVVAAVLSFEFRNTSFLLPVFPAMAVLAAGVIPRKQAPWALAMAAILFAGKVLMPAHSWGIPFAAESTNPAEAALDQYAALGRGNDLIVVQPDDQFYSTDLNLPRVRYVYLDPRTQRRHFPLDFEYLGILMTAADFSRLTELRPQFEQRLREWGLDSGDPIATTILAANQREIAALIEEHADADFLLPQPGGAHKIVLSSRAIQSRPPQPSASSGWSNR